MQTSWNPCSSRRIERMTNQAARKAKNQTMMGSRAPENHISISWVRSCEPRVKLPEFRCTRPRAEWWVSGMFFPFERMSSRAMILHQALVGFGNEAVAKLRILLAQNDVEHELLELADPGQAALARGQHVGG